MAKAPPQNWCESSRGNGFRQIGVKDMTFFKKLWNDNSGASAAEYALILAIVGTGIAGAAWYLGDSVSTAMNTASDCIRTPANVDRQGC